MFSNADMFGLDLEVYDIPATYSDEADFLDDDWSMNINTMASHLAPLPPQMPGTVVDILPPPLPKQPPPLPKQPPPLPKQPPPLPEDMILNDQLEHIAGTERGAVTPPPLPNKLE